MSDLAKNKTNRTAATTQNATRKQAKLAQGRGKGCKWLQRCRAQGTKQLPPQRAKASSRQRPSPSHVGSSKQGSRNRPFYTELKLHRFVLHILPNALTNLTTDQLISNSTLVG